MTEFFYENKLIFTIIHLFGFAIGLGGATIADFLFFKFLKDFKITINEKNILSFLSKIIFTGLFILYLSGIALVLSDPNKFLNSSKFLTKAFIVVVITINGIVLHKVITPKLIKIDWKQGLNASNRKYRKLAFACGSISIISWYSAFILGTLKSIPVTVNIGILIYLSVILLAITASQITENLWCKFLTYKSTKNKIT